MKDSIRIVRHAVLAAVCVIVLTGCTSPSQLVPMPDQSKTVADPNKSRIYMVRPSIIGGAIPMRVFDSGTRIGHTGPKSYLCWERYPGLAQIHSGAENTDQIAFHCKRGNAYYIQQHVKMGAAFARVKLELLSTAEGKKLVAKCKPAK